MLTDLQRAAWEYVTHETLRAQEQFHANAPPDAVIDRIQVAAAYAWALYTDLTRSGHPIHFSEQMRRNRRSEPTDPEFFRHLHALQDFIGQVTYLTEQGEGGSTDV